MIIWNRAIFGAPRASLVIITPSCLSVDNAIIFFISHSVEALIPAINMVDTAKNIKMLLNIVNE